MGFAELHTLSVLKSYSTHIVILKIVIIFKQMRLAILPCNKSSFWKSPTGSSFKLNTAGNFWNPLVSFTWWEPWSYLYNINKVMACKNQTVTWDIVKAFWVEKQSQGTWIVKKWKSYLSVGWHCLPFQTRVLIRITFALSKLANTSWFSNSHGTGLGKKTFN